MPFLFYCLISYLLLFQIVSIKGYGSFWFVTDFHLDQNYSSTGNPLNLCHKENTTFPDVGRYGNFLCDSPLSLVNVSIEAMKHIQPKPDFIIWTGDNLPHTIDFEPDWEVVFSTIKNISFMLAMTFPNTKIFPSIGNHDTFPPNELLSEGISDTIYDGYLQKGGWNKFLSENASFTFQQGGYYSEVITPGLRIISLNTILWYFPNKYTEAVQDPANQFKWLKKTLQKSLLLSEKIYIIGHVPPGYYNRAKPGQKSDPTYHLQFLKIFLEILHQYSDIIIGQMYGHLHMDMFQLFQFNTGVFKSSSILASSLTPWHFIDEYNISLPVNPSLRLMHYSDSDFSLLNYDQFYLNLSKVNSENNPNSGGGNLYELLYKFTDFYGVPDLSTDSLLKVYELLKKNESIFESFFKFLTAGKESVTCEKDCKTSQLCAISAISSDEYDLCMKTVDNANIQSPFFLNVYVLTTLIIFASIIILLFIYLRIRKIKLRKSCNRVEYESYTNF